VNAPIGQPDPVTSIDWVHRANALQAPWGMFVDGEQRPAISGSVRAVLSPRDGATVVELGWADEKDVDVAVAAARRAFDEGPWPEDQLMPIEVSKGTVILLHGLLPHRSFENRSTKSRHAYTLHLIHADAKYPDDNWLQRSTTTPLRSFD